jgi:dihydroorotase
VTTSQALAYKKELEAIDPSIDYLMTLYLSPDITPDEIRKASKAGIVGLWLTQSHLDIGG